MWFLALKSDFALGNGFFFLIEVKISIDYRLQISLYANENRTSSHFDPES